MMTFFFNDNHREPIKANSIDELRREMKYRVFRKGYKAISAIKDGESFHKIYGKDFDGNVIEDDYIGDLYQGNRD